MLRAALLLAALPAFAQPQFEVASVKPSAPVGPGETFAQNLGSIRNAELTLANATLADCIKFAYSLPSDDQVIGPEWVKSKEVRFDIDAKAAGATPRETLLLMLRPLLAEHFHLEMHTERRAFPHYVLAAGKGAPKLKEVPFVPGASRTTFRNGLIAHNQISMPIFAMLLSRQLRQLVLDETGLKETYELKVEWSLQIQYRSPGGAVEPSEPAPEGPSIFTAIQQQLGLKLEGRKDGVEVHVIDRADRVPVSN